MYTKMQFGKDLKERVISNQNILEIGAWAYSVHSDYFDVKDVEFLDLLLRLGMMELGSDFAFTYEELDMIADNLIAGKDVNLDDYR